MSNEAAPEPTMEEILASIRRIISEDESPAPAEAKPDEAGWQPPAPATEAQAEPAPADDDEDVLELTEQAHETHGDVEAYDRPDEPEAEDEAAHMAEPAPMVEPEPAAPPVSATVAPPAQESGSLLAADAAERSASAFDRLAAATRRPAPPSPTPAPALPPSTRTLEDLAREVMAPLVKAWLDDNLPRMVQERVDEEVERIARGRVR